MGTAVTLIALLAIPIILALIWLFKCIVIVNANQYTLIAKWGAAPTIVLKPGLRFIFWPIYVVYGVIEVKRIMLNITGQNTSTDKPFSVTCGIDPRAFSEAVKGKNVPHNGVAELTPQELSVNFDITFFTLAEETSGKHTTMRETEIIDAGKIETYYRLLDATAKDLLQKLKEEVSDIVLSKLRAAVAGMDILAAIKLDPAIIEAIRLEVEQECNARHLPVNISTLKMNKPLRPVNPVIAEALTQIAQGDLLSSVEKIQLARRLRIAEQEVEIKRKEGEGQAASMEAVAKGQAASMEAVAKGQAASMKVLAEAYGLRHLPEAEHARFWLSKDALAAFQKMAENPGAKFVISGSILAEIDSMLSRFSKGS